MFKIIPGSFDKNAMKAFNLRIHVDIYCFLIQMKRINLC